MLVPLPLSVPTLEGAFGSADALTVVRSLLLPEYSAPSMGPACAADGVAGMDSVAFRPFSLHKIILCSLGKDLITPLRF